MATVLGSVACLSSLIFLVVVMQARNNDFIAKVVSPRSRLVNDNVNCDTLRYVSWGEAQTMVYLKISLSDFLTLFASRTRFWYGSLLLLLLWRDDDDDDLCNVVVSSGSGIAVHHTRCSLPWLLLQLHQHCCHCGGHSLLKLPSH